jgi:hypothetical protein
VQISKKTSRNVGAKAIRDKISLGYCVLLHRHAVSLNPPSGLMIGQSY